MPYTIESIELFVRETKPGRMLFTLGKHGDATQRTEGLTSPLAHVRLVLSDGAGRKRFGCSADRLSVRWLDKRPGRSQDLKRRELVALIETAREIALATTPFAHPFGCWRQTHPAIMRAGAERNQEALTSAFASALIERAVLDAFCRIENVSFFQAVKEERLGIELAAIHPELTGLRLSETIADRPRTAFWIRHTVGASDPLTRADLGDRAVNDGLPETLQEYIEEDGVRFFKIKVTGEPERDLERLGKIWDVVMEADSPVLTLDANEAYEDLDRFAAFVARFEQELTGCFQHVDYIEQPLPRGLTLDPATAPAVRRIAERKPLLIDEADGTTDAFRQALAIGYAGVSHKNCKGVFKSLANHALAYHRALHGEYAFLSGEDLQNLPIVPLQQDFTTLSVLGLEHCERNGHHYNDGLSMLSAEEKAKALAHHPDLYVKREGEAYLQIVDGRVRCGSLQAAGFGVQDEPDWQAMRPLRDWVEQRHPA